MELFRQIVNGQTNGQTLLVPKVTIVTENSFFHLKHPKLNIAFWPSVYDVPLCLFCFFFLFWWSVWLLWLFADMKVSLELKMSIIWLSIEKHWIFIKNFIHPSQGTNREQFRGGFILNSDLMQIWYILLFRFDQTTIFVGSPRNSSLNR